MRQDGYAFSGISTPDSRQRLTGPDDVVRLVGDRLRGATRESLHVFHLDSNRHLLGQSEAGGGSEGHVDLPIRRIIAEALELGSSMLVVAHNHPSGDPQPSHADKTATRKLAEVTKALDIRLVDHVILAKGRHYSFAESGLL